MMAEQDTELRDTVTACRSSNQTNPSMQNGMWHRVWPLTKIYFHLIATAGEKYLFTLME